MEERITEIAQLSEAQIQKTMQAIENWYAVRYPNYYVCYIAVHKDPESRKKELEQIIRMLRMEPGMENFMVNPPLSATVSLDD